MQIAANTTGVFARTRTAFRSMFSTTPTVTYSICVPGMESIGSYDTIEQAEAALHYLPFSVRQQAAIYDADGYCVRR